MKSAQAHELGRRIAALVETGQTEKAYILLAPALAERTPFDMLRRVGRATGAGPLEPANAFLERIAAGKTEGGWVVIASMLEGQLGRDLAGALARGRQFIIAADIWYAADTLGEGVVGAALVTHFEPVLELLKPWREDSNPWVRRVIGVGVHLWAKRARGQASHAAQARTLMGLLEPLFEERDVSVVKGVGWGLKTLGRYYPDLAAEWLAEQQRQRHPCALMLRKARTYLPKENA
ncbi:MAG: DNA alkylation repair protein [Thermoflexales bacterium]|nr:DNA alkylation repair protein [Thermoflexales bacterium]